MCEDQETCSRILACHACHLWVDFSHTWTHQDRPHFWKVSDISYYSTMISSLHTFLLLHFIIPKGLFYNTNAFLTSMNYTYIFTQKVKTSMINYCKTFSQLLVKLDSQYYIKDWVENFIEWSAFLETSVKVSVSGFRNCQGKEASENRKKKRGETHSRSLNQINPYFLHCPWCTWPSIALVFSITFVFLYIFHPMFFHYNMHDIKEIDISFS